MDPKYTDEFLYEPHEPPLSDDPTFWNAAFNAAFSTFTFVIGFGLGFYVAFRSMGP